MGVLRFVFIIKRCSDGVVYCKKYQSELFTQRVHGITMKSGDIITVRLDLKKKQISLKNGNNSGVVFSQIPSHKKLFYELAVTLPHSNSTENHKTLSFVACRPLMSHQLSLQSVLYVFIVIVLSYFIKMTPFDSKDQDSRMSSENRLLRM